MCVCLLSMVSNATFRSRDLQSRKFSIFAQYFAFLTTTTFIHEEREGSLFIICFRTVWRIDAHATSFDAAGSCQLRRTDGRTDGRLTSAFSDARPSIIIYAQSLPLALPQGFSTVDPRKPKVYLKQMFCLLPIKRTTNKNKGQKQTVSLCKAGGRSANPLGQVPSKPDSEFQFPFNFHTNIAMLVNFFTIANHPNGWLSLLS